MEIQPRLGPEHTDEKRLRSERLNGDIDGWDYHFYEAKSVTNELPRLNLLLDTEGLVVAIRLLHQIDFGVG